VGTLGVHLSAPAQQWLAAGPDQIDELRRKFRQLRQPVDALRGATDRVAEIAAEPPAVRPREVVIERRVSSSLIEHAQPIVIAVVSVLIL
ncbi:hypothetical protein NPN19_24580, partial [Vibrio parahaemolyticus]|uniref:hypothetical protein n=1 Tax=Vibrio parahaemolyticus TaxID=670 RepID=UPI0021114224